MENPLELRRTKRLLDMVWRIASAPRRWSRRCLAEHYEISERQVTKDLEVLRHGLLFEIKRAPEGYYFEQVPRLPTASFAFEEALVLLLAVRAEGTLAGVDGKALAAAIGRLESLFPRDLRPVIRAEGAHDATPTSRESTLALLHTAIGRRRRLRMRYAAASRDGAITERTIHPYAVIPYVKSWHVVGYCHLRGDIRLFKIDRIARPQLLDDQFAAPVDFDLGRNLNEGWWRMPGIDGPSEEIILRFRPPSAHFVAEERWHAGQEVAWQDDGTMLFRVHVAVTPELQRWVFRYGRDVDVLAPRELRAWVRDEARAVLGQDEAIAGSSIAQERI